jgi:hypothetical protein
MAPYSFTTSQKGGVRVVIPFSVKEEEKKRDHQTTTQKVFTEERKEKKEPHTPDTNKTTQTPLASRDREIEEDNKKKAGREKEGRKEGTAAAPSRDIICTQEPKYHLQLHINTYAPS